MPLNTYGKVSVGCPPPPSSLGLSGDEWKSFQFHFHDFAALSTTRSHYIDSPEFTSSGHQWQLKVHPGGDGGAVEGQVSVFLYYLSEGSFTTNYQQIDTSISSERNQLAIAASGQNSHPAVVGVGKNSSLAPTSWTNPKIFWTAMALLPSSCL